MIKGFQKVFQKNITKLSPESKVGLFGAGVGFIGINTALWFTNDKKENTFAKIVRHAFFSTAFGGFGYAFPGIICIVTFVKSFEMLYGYCAYDPNEPSGDL